MNLNTSIDEKFIYKHLTNSSNPKGIIHISHGMAEHIGRYKWLIDKLNKDGYHVISLDHRGHGKRIEDGCKGYFADNNGWELVINDQINLVKNTKKNYPYLKQFMIGHSMGSWIALNALQNGMKVDGLILSGSSKIPYRILILQKILLHIILLVSNKKSVSKFLDNLTLGQYNKDFEPNRTQKDWISSDNHNVDEYIADPLCGYPVTNGLWHDLSRGLKDTFNSKFYINTNIELPIYIISGKKDPVGEHGKGVTDLYIFLNKIFKKVEIYLIDNARHEVFSEINKEDNYKLTIEFIEKNLIT